MVDGQASRYARSIPAMVGLVALIAAIPGISPASHALAQHGAAKADRLDGNTLVRPSLTLEHTALVPGETSHLGVRLVMHEGWHIYWRNHGDSGLPPEVTFEAVDGLVIGKPQWPTPKRYITGGEVLDYIYENEVVLVFPVEVASSLRPGSTVTLRAMLEWLVCKEMCLPGDGAVELTVPVAASAARSADARLFDQARASHPVPLDRAPVPVGVAWKGRTLVLSSSGADELTFFPYESDANVYPQDMIAGGHRKGDELHIRYDDAVRNVAAVHGVLAVRRDGKDYYVLIEAPTEDRAGS